MRTPKNPFTANLKSILHSLVRLRMHYKKEASKKSTAAERFSIFLHYLLDAGSALHAGVNINLRFVHKQLASRILVMQ